MEKAPPEFDCFIFFAPYITQYDPLFGNCNIFFSYQLHSHNLQQVNLDTQVL